MSNDNDEKTKDGWYDVVRQWMFVILAVFAALCGVLRATGQADKERVSLEVLFFFLAAGALLVFETIRKLSVGKDGLSLETAMKEAVEEGVKPVEEKVDAVQNKQKENAENILKAITEQVGAQVDVLAKKTLPQLGDQATGVGKLLADLKTEIEAVTGMVKDTQKILSEGAAKKGGAPASTVPLEVAEANAAAGDKGAANAPQRYRIPKRGTADDDQQKGRFGGSPTNNGLVLMAKVQESEYSPGLYDITLVVQPEDGSGRTLTGEVYFYLHETFSRQVRRVPVIDGKATETAVAYGAFTVGALADDRTTPLELDLSELKNAPRKFKEN